MGSKVEARGCRPVARRVPCLRVKRWHCDSQNPKLDFWWKYAGSNHVTFCPFLEGKRLVHKPVSSFRHMGVSKNRGTPNWMVYNDGKPYQNGWFGGTTIFGNIHISDGQKKGPFWEQKKRGTIWFPWCAFFLELLLPNGNPVGWWWFTIAQTVKKSQKKQKTSMSTGDIFIKLRKKTHPTQDHRNLHRFVPVKTNVTRLTTRPPKAPWVLDSAKRRRKSPVAPKLLVLPPWYDLPREWARRWMSRWMSRWTEVRIK